MRLNGRSAHYTLATVTRLFGRVMTQDSLLFDVSTLSGQDKAGARWQQVTHLPELHHRALD